MAELFGRVRDIRAKAELSEKMVQEITRFELSAAMLRFSPLIPARSDIKSLDHAKKNLTLSITTLNHLHMLVGGVDSLAALADKCQYGDAAHLLAAITEVQQHFARYMHIDRVQDLARKCVGRVRKRNNLPSNRWLPHRVDLIKDQLGRQI